MHRRRKAGTLVVGGGPGGRVAYMALSQMGQTDTMIVMNEEPTVVCSLPYGVGRRLIPGGPEDVVVDLSKSPRLPGHIVDNTVHGHVSSLDKSARKAVIETAHGTVTISYEKVILATGALPWLPPVHGILQEETPSKTTGEYVQVGTEVVDKSRLAENIHVVRNANDARRLDAFAENARKAVVVGSGAIGLETAEALYDRGLEVTIVETLPHVAAPLDSDMAEMIEKRLAEKGIAAMTSQKVVLVTGEGVTLETGEHVFGESVIFATGVRPNVTLARQAGLRIDRGIVTDATMKTSDANIYAVGDAVQVPDAATGKPVLPLVGTLAMRHAIAAASNIAGMPMEIAPATVWGVSAVLDLHWGSVGWTEELAKRENLAVRSVSIPVRTREEAMPSGREGRWKIVVAEEGNEGIKKGQILGFQIILDGESPLGTTERFIDIVTSGETVSDLFRHFAIHSPSHNPPDDPYLNLFMRYSLS